MISMNIDNVKKECYAIARKYYPAGSPKAFGLYQDLFAKHLTKETRLLNAGCGKGKENLVFKDVVQFSVGVDLDKDSLRENQLYHALINSNLDDLPFNDKSFDLIISQNVLEHLEHPDKVFSEFARVLKPGGRLIFLTPNIYGYVSLISKITPTAFHVFFNALRGQEESDIFPTFYRANSRNRLKNICSKTGFKVEEMTTFQKWPSYLIFSKTLFRLGIVYERLVNRFNTLSFLRSVIIACVQKV